MRAIAAVQVAVNLISMGRLGIYSVLYGMKTFIDTGVVEFGVLSFAVQCLLYILLCHPFATSISPGG